MIGINWHPERRQLRQFGLAGLAIFMLVGLLVMWRGRIVGISVSPNLRLIFGGGLMVLSVVCGLLATLKPALLRGLYRGMSVVAFPLGYVVTGLLMVLLFYGIFTPVAIIFRLIGRDVLRLKPAPALTSFWQTRRQQNDVSRYFRQS